MPNMKQRKQLRPLEHSQVKTSFKQDIAFRNCCHYALFHNLNSCSMWSVAIVNWLEEHHKAVQTFHLVL